MDARHRWIYIVTAQDVSVSELWHDERDRELPASHLYVAER